VARLRDGQLGDPRVHDISTTSAAASSGRRSPRPASGACSIDEIDKADIEFPNDLLQELDRMEFHVYETRRR
jgi:MoxR-like ATPase